MALASMVCCLTSSERAVCKARIPCCSTLLTETNLTSGREAASQIAAASAASFFLPFLTKGLTASGANQLHRMTKATENARPVMRGTTGLHHHRATFLLLEECNQVAPAQLALELYLSGLVDAVDLEDGLGGIQADHAKAHGGRLPCCRFQRPAVWHIDAVGAVHPICKGQRLQGPAPV